jgi:hypothetical protein
MKLSLSWKGLALAVALLLANGAFAANKGVLDVHEAVTLNGQSVPAGHYDVKWEGAGPDVQVSLVQGKKVVATAPAHLVPSSTAYSSDTAVLEPSAGGAKSLTEIRCYGKKYALAVGGGNVAEATSK